MAMNNGGIRDTACVLKVVTSTVMTTLPLDGDNIQLICEMDERGSFGGNKKNQRWLWYAWESRLKRIVAHVFGDRSRKTLDKLLTLLSPLTIPIVIEDA
ncbi:insertion element IS1 protein InsB [Xenorhabdus japonica]|uniref:Insertion element IS1 protein InsB n=1 Tax=Xenorhabdus japonica TaxID=53341 RepID=A0A1I5E183_9GAMM|nr:insertion element IS1 protein InsB [Xenorhabdus japonica]